MEEAIKGRVILILGILAVIFLVGTIGSCASAGRMKFARDKEMATRLDLEEKISKFSQEKSAMDQKIKSVAQSLEEEKVAHQTTKKALLQEQLVGQSLKEELAKVTKLKEALEEDLKEALVNSKKSKR